MCATTALSQTADQGTTNPNGTAKKNGVVPLPPVQVEASKAPKKAATPAAPTKAPAAAPEKPETAAKSPKGFVAKQSSAGTKTDTPILETPQSISVVTRDQLDTRNVSTVVEALQYVPGIYTHPGGKDPRFDQYTIRGFNSQGYGAFRDGLKEIGSADNFNHFRTEPYGLERVDVIRGPSSVLYGQIAPGGLVNVITKRPTEERIREVEGQIGSDNKYQGAFDLGGKLNDSGTVLFRLTGLARESNAQVAHFSNFIPDDRLFIAPSFTVKPDSRTTFTVLTDYQHDRSGHAFPVPVLTSNSVGALPLYMGEPSFNKFEQDQLRAGYQFEHRFNDAVTVRQNLRYGEISLDYRYLTAANVIVPGVTTSLSRVARSIYEKTNTFTVDNQVETKVVTGPIKHTILTGVDYQQFWLDSTTLGGTAPSLIIANPVYGQTVATPTTKLLSTDQNTRQTGAYVQDQAKFGNFVTTLGGRYDWSDVNTLNRLTAKTVDAMDSAFTGRAGLAYVFASGFAPYASYSTSFLPTTGVDYASNPFKPVTGQQYEAGIKYEPPGARSRLTLAAFDLTQQNVLTLDTLHSGPSYACASNCQTQTGEIRSRGFEAELTANPVAGLQLVAAYTLMDIEVTKSNQGNVGKVPIITPQELASIFADYTFQGGPLAGFGFGGGVRYIGESYKDLANVYKNPGYAVIDAVLHYKLDVNTTLQLNASNLFNRDEVTCTTTGGCQYISPRIVTATVKYRW
ncbi:MAG: TonB-dependent siderophore receptor [Hyphomicrobiales bacterium]|nr:MAG: TonB-dependent siderophore receptor [Hyphomicrobiales bacterium]